MNLVKHLKIVGFLQNLYWNLYCILSPTQHNSIKVPPAIPKIDQGNNDWFFETCHYGVHSPGNSRPKLCPTFGCCPQWFFFLKFFFYPKQSKYAINIGVDQIRGALYIFFYSGKVPFYISEGCCLPFLEQLLPLTQFFLIPRFFWLTSQRLSWCTCSVLNFLPSATTILLSAKQQPIVVTRSPSTSQCVSVIFFWWYN